MEILDFWDDHSQYLLTIPAATWRANADVVVVDELIATYGHRLPGGPLMNGVRHPPRGGKRV